MKRFLPTCPHWLRFAAVFLIGIAAGLPVSAQDEDPEEEPPPEEEEEEVIKQLVFIEEHLDTSVGGTVEKLRGIYDVRFDPTGTHLYVAAQFDDAISIFSRDDEEGELTFIGDVDETDIGENALNGARSIAVSPDGEFIYAVSQFSDSLVTFDRNTSTGALTFLDSIYDTDPGVDGLDGNRSITISPDGKNLYVAATDDDKLSVFSRNTNTGIPSFLGVYEEGDQGVEELTEPHALIVSPDGQHVYVALFKNEIVVFDRDDSNGLLTYNSKLSYLLSQNGGQLVGTPRAIAISPDGAFIYVTSWNTDSLSVFSRDAETGELAHEKDYLNNFDGTEYMDSPHSLVISSDGAYIYVAAFSSDAVTSFQRDAETGDLGYFQSIFPGEEDEWKLNGPQAITVSPDGEQVYVGNASVDYGIAAFNREILVDPPEFVVQPTDKSIEEGETVAFYALAQGLDVSYQWSLDGSPINGATLPVYTIDSAALSQNGDVLTVTATNAGGSIVSDSATLTVLPPIVIEAPLNLTALDISSNSANLVWSDESDNETSFEIQRRVTGGEFAAITTVLANQSTYVDATLVASTSYRYRVAAKRNDTYSLWSNEAVIESFDDIPQKPAGLELIEETYNKIIISWSDRSAVEDGYAIFRRKEEIGSAWEQIATTDQNSDQYEDRAVLPDTVYAYRVRAFNESGNSDYSNSIVAITSTIPVDAISPVERILTKDASTGHSISVTSTKEWEAVPDSSWIIVTSPSGGNGFADESVTYRVLLNESQNERVGVIVVGGLDHTITQGGSPPFMRIQPARTEVSAEASTPSISIESNQDWVAAESADWFSISSGAAGTDYGTIQLAIDENDSLEARSAILQINDQSHLVEQAGKIPFLNLSSADSSVARESGTGEVSISSNIDWTASVSEEWIRITSTASGSGNATLAFEFDLNETNDIRTADIQVNETSITITQSGPEVVPEYLNISSDDTNFPSEGGIGEVSISSNTQWAVRVSSNWMTVTSEESGEGDATLTFQVHENPTTEARVGEVLLNGKAITFTQAAFVIVISDITPPSFTSASVSNNIGVQLNWNDNSSTENGFLLRRSIAGEDDFIDLIELPANQTSYLDRNAQRGKSFEYRIAALDNIGRSTEDSITTAVLPASNITAIATRIIFNPQTPLYYANFAFGGEGRLTSTIEGFGDNLSQLPLGGPTGARIVEVGDGTGEPFIVSNTTAINWNNVFSFSGGGFGSNAAAGLDEETDAIEFGIRTANNSGGYSRGVSAQSYINDPNTKLFTAFEITGNVDLPILIKGIGPGLSRQGIGDILSDPQVALFSIENGTTNLIATNDNWGTWSGQALVTLQDANAKTNTAPLGNIAESLILIDLPPGKYVAILGGNGAQTGAARLEVLDAR